MTTFSGDVQEMKIDNVVIRDTAFVYDARGASNPRPGEGEPDVATEHLTDALDVARRGESLTSVVLARAYLATLPGGEPAWSAPTNSPVLTPVSDSVRASWSPLGVPVRATTTDDASTPVRIDKIRNRTGS